MLKEITSLGQIKSSYTPPALGKIITGAVGATGTIIAGTGYTVTKGATGVYTINFTVPFSATPLFIFDAMGFPGNPNQYIVSASASAVQINLGGTSDQPFNFMAMDQR